MKCCEKKTIILLAKKWKLTNLVERQVKDPFAITCPNGKKIMFPSKKQSVR